MDRANDCSGTEIASDDVERIENICTGLRAFIDVDVWMRI